MVRETHVHGETLYVCEFCGLLYKEKYWAQRCEAYCKEHNACSLDIMQHAVHTKAGDKKPPKALALFSGGLDSMLAIKVVMDQGVEVEAVHFMNPFSAHNENLVKEFCEEVGIKLHQVALGQELLDIVVKPKHGYGSQLNPCIDCRILTLRKAKDLAEKIGADFLVTGEVLDERPFSQRRETMLLIEKEAGLEGKILRPLSAKLLPETTAEKQNLIDRKKLLAIRGRRRLPQLRLAEKLGIKRYLNPSGGCLLTDPRFAERLKEHLAHEEKLTMTDVALLRLGRHFRIKNVKVIVGRNKEENEKLLSISGQNGNFVQMEVTDYMGPVTLLLGKPDFETVQKAAAITVRYSDAPSGIPVRVRYATAKGERVIKVQAASDDELRQFSIQKSAASKRTIGHR